MSILCVFIWVFPAYIQQHLVDVGTWERGAPGRRWRLKSVGSYSIVKNSLKEVLTLKYNDIFRMCGSAVLAEVSLAKGTYC